MTPKNQEVQSLWDQKAEFWDGLMGETGSLFQRRLAALGAKVVAVDFSPRMIELALGYFDSVVCNMAIMDMVDIRPMLHPGGRFVFTLTHPRRNAARNLLPESHRLSEYPAGAGGADAVGMNHCIPTDLA